VTHQKFGLDDLNQILVVKSGLPPGERVADPDCTFVDVGLDSLAFLALQAELDERFGFELPDEAGHQTFAGILAAINDRLSQKEMA
jgi:minimal PKS acyl carrier protein